MSEIKRYFATKTHPTAKAGCELYLGENAAKKCLKHGWAAETLEQISTMPTENEVNIKLMEYSEKVETKVLEFSAEKVQTKKGGRKKNK